MQKKRISSETVLSVSAIVIAIVSIVVTLWQGLELRQHNRLSVRPLLDLSYDLDYNKNIVQFTIKNKGLGPAILGKSTAVVNGSEFLLNDINEYFEFLEKLGVNNLPITFDLLELDGTIMSNESKKLLVIELSHFKELKIKPQTLLNNTVITINYKSMYNEEFVTQSGKGYN